MTFYQTLPRTHHVPLAGRALLRFQLQRIGGSCIARGASPAICVAAQWRLILARSHTLTLTILWGCLAVSDGTLCAWAAGNIRQRRDHGPFACGSARRRRQHYRGRFVTFLLARYGRPWFHVML